MELLGPLQCDVRKWNFVGAINIHHYRNYVYSLLPLITINDSLFEVQ